VWGWVAGKIVWSPRYTRPISESLSSGASHNKALYKYLDYSYSCRRDFTSKQFETTILFQLFVSRCWSVRGTVSHPAVTTKLQLLPTWLCSAANRQTDRHYHSKWRGHKLNLQKVQEQMPHCLLLAWVHLVIFRVYCLFICYVYFLLCVCFSLFLGGGGSWLLSWDLSLPLF